jgi:hypothetical protein
MPNIEGHLHRPQAAVAWRTIRTLRYDFFISYRYHEAREYAARLAAELKEMGFRVFLDRDHPLDGLNDTQLQDQLLPALHSAAAIVHVLSAKPFDGEWTRWESDVFYAGRFGLTIGLMTEVTSEDQQVLWRMRRQIDSVLVHEEANGAWSESEPSVTTCLNLAVAAALYRALLRLKLWIWLVPKSMRLRIHDYVIHRDRAFRHWAGAYLVYHGFVEPPPQIPEARHRNEG